MLKSGTFHADIVHIIRDLNSSLNVKEWPATSKKILATIWPPKRAEKAIYSQIMGST